MENPEDLLVLLKNYLELYPMETQRQSPFHTFLNKTSFENLYDRKNHKGHVTASAFIVDDVEKRMLLIHHKILDRWLQPGGHVDYTDVTLLDAAYRECEEETNLSKADLELVVTGPSPHMPLDIDTHLIPENNRKNEPEHFHYDVRFLFMCTGYKNLNVNTTEVNDYSWISFDELAEDVTFSRVVEKIREVVL